ILSPTSRVSLTVANTAIRDILNALAGAAGITITYDRDLESSGQQGIGRQTSVQMDDLTIDQALNQILSANQLAYKVVTPRMILVFADTPQKHQTYDDQVIQTFQISHSDPAALAALL